MCGSNSEEVGFGEPYKARASLRERNILITDPSGPHTNIKGLTMYIYVFYIRTDDFLWLHIT